MFRFARARTLAYPLTGALSLSLLACASVSPGTGGAPAAGQVALPVLQRLVMHAEPPTTERSDFRAGRTVDLIPFRPVYEYPLGIDAKTGKVIPQLATSWALEPDGASVRFQLLKGVQFHQGKGEFKAADVIYNWKLRRDFDPSVPSSNAPIYQNIETIDAVNDYEIIVRLKAPDGTFLTTNFTEGRGLFQIFSSKHFEEIGTPTMLTGPVAGTGPYQFKERVQGSFVRHERVPYKHWRVTPDFPEFEFRYAKEASTRMAALLTGEVQIADLPEDLKVEALKKGYKAIRSQIAGNQVFVGFGCCHYKDPKNPAAGFVMPESPLVDVRVRRALAKSIDRDELNKSFFGGDAVPLYLLNFHPTRPGWNTDWERNFKSAYGYDPEAAKAELAQAGYNAGNPLVVHMQYPAETRGGFSGDDMADSIANHWRKIGVQVKPLNVDPSQVTGLRNQFRLENQVTLGNSASDQWTGATTMGSTTSFGTRGRQPDNLNADRALEGIATTMDEKRADQLWREVGNEYYTTYRTSPLFTLAAEAVVDPKVVADWVFPGTVTGYWSHVFDIKAVK